MSRRVLVVVDMQNDFCTGSLKNNAAVAVIPFIKEKIEEFRKEGSPVIYTKDTHFKDYLDTPEGKSIPVPHCIKDTEGWEVVDELYPTENDIIIEKNDFKWDGPWSGVIKEALDPCCEDELELTDETLEDVIVEIVGVCTDICVIGNAEAISEIPGVKTVVHAKGCAGLTPEKHEEALLKMENFKNTTVVR